MNELATKDDIDFQAQEAVRRSRRAIDRLGDKELGLMFLAARSFNGWKDEPVSDAQIREIYELMKMGPTSANVCPLRIKMVRSEKAKKILEPILFERNRAKTMQAPAIAIFGNDHEFFHHNAELTPFRPSATKERMEENPQLVPGWAMLNGTLQAAYFIMAVRAVGLDAGPMQGFDKRACDEAFWSGTAVKTNFICAIGRGNEETIFRRLPRLEFEAACETV